MNYFRNSCIFITIIVIVALVVVTCKPVEYFPDEGEWYCEELEMQLAFGSDGNCFVMINGQEMKCGCGSDKGSNYLSVGCQELNCDHCYLGEEIFCATFVSLNNTVLIVEDVSSGIQYSFVRTS